MNKSDTEVIGRVISAELDGLRAEFKAAIAAVADMKMIPGPAGPVGKTGEPGRAGPDGLNGSDGADGKDGETGPRGPAGKDGGAGIDGKDGADGRDGRDGRDGLDAFELPIAAGIDSEQTYQRGALATNNGGLWRFDGVEWKCLLDSLADVEMTQVDERTLQVTQVFASGLRKSVDYRVPAMVYREIYKAETEYEPGDFVTHNGSIWACIKPTEATPGTKDGGWRLAVKRGLNGRSK